MNQHSASSIKHQSVWDTCALFMDRNMQAVLLKGHGGFEQLEFRDDVPIPEPAPGEVLIRVGAAGVNNTDINTRTGWYSHAVAGPADSSWTGAPPQFPRIQGADA